MKAIAKELISPDRTLIYDPLRFRPSEVLFVHYTEIVERFGHLVNTEKLVDAYRLAGDSFKGRMTQTFWLLNDDSIIVGQNRNELREPIAK